MGKRGGKSNVQARPANGHVENNQAEKHADKGSSVPSPYGKVLRQYRIYWKIPQGGVKPILLQFPSRSPAQPYGLATNQKPLEMRIKPRSGIVEIDIPLSLDRSYNRERGLRYGMALQKSMVLQAGGDYGLAGGFGINRSGLSAKREDEDGNEREHEEHGERVDDDDEDEEGTWNYEYDGNFEYYSQYFEEAREKGLVMDRLTLAGQFHVRQDGDPIMAFGTIRGSQSLPVQRFSPLHSADIHPRRRNPPD